MTLAAVQQIFPVSHSTVIPTSTQINLNQQPHDNCCSCSLKILNLSQLTRCRLHSIGSCSSSS